MYTHKLFLCRSLLRFSLVTAFRPLPSLPMAGLKAVVVRSNQDLHVDLLIEEAQARERGVEDVGTVGAAVLPGPTRTQIG
jgi:hypothetical protein